MWKQEKSILSDKLINNNFYLNWFFPYTEWISAQFLSFCKKKKKKYCQLFLNISIYYYYGLFIALGG